MTTPAPHAITGEFDPAPREVSWAPKPNALNLHLVPPPNTATTGGKTTSGAEQVPAPATSVRVFVFDANEQLLVVDVASRSTDLPGGHIETGEDADEAAIREVIEEAGLHLAHPGRVLGYQHLHITGAAPDDYPYPYPDSYQPAYLVTLDHTPHVSPVAVDEILDARFVPARDAYVDFAERGLSWAPLLEYILDNELHRGSEDIARSAVL